MRRILSGNRPESRIATQFEYFKVLDNYRNISSPDDFCQIFPDGHKYVNKEGFDIDFALGMVALENKPYKFTELFGLSCII